MKHKWIKRIGIFCVVFAVLIVVVAGTSLLSLRFRTNSILEDISGIYTNEAYQTPILLEGVEVIKQDVSCGYAVIQMFSHWNGGQITEQSLYDQYGKVVTSTGKSFCAEMNKQFPEYTTTMYKYRKNTELIAGIYENLSAGIPVPIEWAALYGEDWTLHYSLVYGIDIPGDTVTVANPYGYVEELGIREFLERTSFEAYEDMPLFLKMGFAFGIFEKNTMFRVE